MLIPEVHPSVRALWPDLRRHFDDVIGHVARIDPALHPYLTEFTPVGDGPYMGALGFLRSAQHEFDDLDLTLKCVDGRNVATGTPPTDDHAVTFVIGDGWGEDFASLGPVSLPPPPYEVTHLRSLAEFVAEIGELLAARRDLLGDVIRSSVAKAE